MASKGNIPSVEPHPALVKALRRLLRPLIKLLISRQITFPWFSGFLKSIYVEVALDDFQINGVPPNDSRVTFLTGVHRKDVRRLREGRSEGVDQAPKSVHLGGLLVSKWCSDPDYLNDSGHPMALSRLARKDGGPSFESLVSSVSKDFRARAVLDEWLRMGIVELVDDDCVQLKTEAFVPREGLEEKLYYLGQNVEAHLAACVHNIEGVGSPMMERCVYYDGLTEENIRELEDVAKRGAMETIQVVNRMALKLRNENRQRDEVAKTGKINYGFYLHHVFPGSDDEVNTDDGGENPPD